MHLVELIQQVAGESLDVRRARVAEILAPLSLAEISAEMDAVRTQEALPALLDAIVEARSGCNSEQALKRRWRELLEGKGHAPLGIDFMVETLTHVAFDSEHPSCYIHPVIHIQDYAQTVPHTLIHETYHGFNARHGLGGGHALNEGTAIAVFKYYFGDEVNLAETIFGTVNYYRDIGIQGYPRRFLVGDAWEVDAKGYEALRYLMAADVSGVDWFDGKLVERVYRKFWRRLNRNVDFFNVWLPAAQRATERGLLFMKDRAAS
jgi:hypothetical protein